MLSLSLGPIALPLAPFLLLIAIWGSSWLASRRARQGADKVSGEQAGRTVTHAALLGLVAARLAYLVWHADAYLASPWAAFDLRDGGWSAPAGLVALSDVDESVPRHAAVAAHLHERNGDIELAAELYAAAAHDAPTLAERAHQTLQAARCNQQLRNGSGRRNPDR